MELRANTRIFRYKVKYAENGTVELDCQDPKNRLDLAEWKPLVQVMGEHGHGGHEYEVRAEHIPANDTVFIYVNTLRMPK